MGSGWAPLANHGFPVGEDLVVVVFLLAKILAKSASSGKGWLRVVEVGISDDGVGGVEEEGDSKENEDEKG